MNNIFINQLGYLPNHTKYFITNEPAETFTITSIDDQVLYSGTLKLHSEKDISTGEKLYIGYFTGLDREGKYIISLDNGNQSYPFKINTKIYNETLHKSLKSFYFQRCGIPLPKEQADEFSRDCCHTGITTYHESVGKKGGKDVSGGWHDAGDYGRYVTPGCISLGIMMIGYEQYPEKFNSIGFIEEIKYELDWILKMQELDDSSSMYGAVHYMINSKDYNWVTPEKDKMQQFILNYSTVSTADFVAVTAFASRVFKNIDKDYSMKLLDRALLAWNFIENKDHSSIDVYIRPDDLWTGGYTKLKEFNTFKDTDLFWPALELFLITEEEKYHKIVKSHFQNSDRLTGGLTWMDKSGFPEIQYALSKNVLIDKKLQSEIRKKLISRCNKYIEIHNKDGFFTLLSKYDYKWGSNGELLNRSLQLIIGYLLTSNDKFKSAALSQLNYILGLNIHSKSFIAGLGTNYVKNIHHASFQNDDIGYCFPGMLTGGPNSYIEQDVALYDKALYEKCPPGTPPAKCYTDHPDSFSSNENCILYSAPTIPVTAFFSFT